MTGPRSFELACERLPERSVVRGFTGTERTSHCFRFEVDVELPELVDGLELTERLVGERATLTIASGSGDERVVRGVVAAAELSLASARDGHIWLHLRLEPRLAMLARTRGYRIFQDRSVKDVFATLMHDHALPHRVDVADAPVRSYLVQYDETDLAFLERILAEVGWVYAFDPGNEDEGERIVVSDGGSPLHALAQPLPVVHEAGLGGGGYAISELSIRAKVTSAAALERAYSNERPLLDLRTEARVPATAASSGRVYRHAGSREQSGVGREATRTLDQARRRALVARARSSIAELAAGRAVTLVDTGSPQVDGVYHVIGVRHRGGAAAPGAGAAGELAYVNDIECTPDAGAVPRPRMTPRRHVQAMETATVVGPAAHEIHTDALGRVRVHFHWDLDGGSATSSCWIRTAQSWSGDGYGVQFVPRVGMEVVVGFLGGDPDTPVVLGTAWNALHPPPYALPQSKTRSGIRTRSSRASTGYNELSFEDRAGYEAVFLRAERDLDVEARRNETHRVGGAYTESIQGARFTVVGANALTNIAGMVTTSVTGDAHELYRSSVGVTIAGNLEEQISGRVERRLRGDRVEEIRGADRRTVAGPIETTAESGAVLRSTGSFTAVVGTKAAPQAAVLSVEGSVHTRATRRIELECDERLEIRCGKSILAVGPDAIELSSPTVRLAGEDAWIELAGQKVVLSGDEKVVALAKKILAVSEGASLVLDTDAKIAGAHVKLGAASSDSASISSEEGEETTIELVDQRGAPVPRARYRVALDDGSVREGLLDDDGRASLRIRGSATVTFPDRRGVQAS
ncbi:MAG: type VI secretion system tip protein TssI/VgrG [Polyangiaceae bacterium]